MGSAFMQGIQAVYEPFAPLLEQADPQLAAYVQDALSAAFLSVAPYAIFVDGQEEPMPYSFVTVAQRAPIQNAAYTLAGILRQAMFLPRAYSLVLVCLNCKMLNGRCRLASDV